MFTDEVRAWLQQEATERYTQYFLNQWRLKPEEFKLPQNDNEARCYLMDLSDEHAYAWPTDEHPNYDFVGHFHYAADWQKIVKHLRSAYTCPNCSGTGYVEWVENGAPHGEGFWPMTVSDDCGTCGGTGKVVADE